MSIKIFYDDTKYRLRDWKRIRDIIKELIQKESRIPGDLNFILTRDTALREINVQFLEHDYNTDVIAFNYNDKSIINGEIYISIDTVKRNSVNYNVSFKEELIRVMIHGVLHLAGYNDKTEEERAGMRKLEDVYLSQIRGGKDAI